MKTDVLGAKSVSVLLSITNPMWIGQGFNLGLQSEKHMETDTDRCKGLVAR